MSLEMIDRLMRSSDAAVALQTRLRLSPVPPEADELARLQSAVRAAMRVQTLLSERQADGGIPFHPYFKWRGAHWVLYALAELGYPPGDEQLLPLREQVLAWLLPGWPQAERLHRGHIQAVNGRVRNCASMESNALLSLLRLGLADERCDVLARLLIEWQWPDGGWNCDKRPQASHSSFHESLLPLRALALYAQRTGSLAAQDAARRVAEHFLERRLFRRLSTGEVIDSHFLRLHFPAYWHYDLLAGLVALTEAGYVQDERCREALDWLENLRLPDGGFPAPDKFYRVTDQEISGSSRTAWGMHGTTRVNELATVQALWVLRAAGRYTL